MTDHEKPDQTPPVDEETLDTLQQTLYSRLREQPASVNLERHPHRAAEQSIPLYYDLYIASSILRLEQAIAYNTEAIDRLREEMRRGFAEAKAERQRLREEMNRRFAEAEAEGEAVIAEVKAKRK